MAALKGLWLLAGPSEPTKLGIPLPRAPIPWQPHTREKSAGPRYLSLVFESKAQRRRLLQRLGINSGTHRTLFLLSCSSSSLQALYWLCLSRFVPVKVILPLEMKTYLLWLPLTSCRALSAAMVSTDGRALTNPTCVGFIKVHYR